MNHQTFATRVRDGRPGHLVLRADPTAAPRSIARYAGVELGVTVPPWMVGVARSITDAKRRRLFGVRPPSEASARSGLPPGSYLGQVVDDD